MSTSTSHVRISATLIVGILVGLSLPVTQAASPDEALLKRETPDIESTIVVNFDPNASSPVERIQPNGPGSAPAIWVNAVVSSVESVKAPVAAGVSVTAPPLLITAAVSTPLVSSVPVPATGHDWNRAPAFAYKNSP